MRLWVFSDLHRDFGQSFDYLPPEGTDVIVAAGDIQDDELLVRLSRYAPTVFVGGNHEFYNRCLPERLAELKSLSSDTLHILENDQVIIGGVRFLGCTLWTDYGYNPLAAETARRSMNDHRLIKWSKEPYQRFLPSHATKMHQASRAWLSERFAEPFDGKTVVVTHHAPSERSVAPKYAGQILNHAYFSHMDDMIEAAKPAIWVHGHVHSNFSYKIGETRVICNPRGYPLRNGTENPEFDPQMVVEV